MNTEHTVAKWCVEYFHNAVLGFGLLETGWYPQNTFTSYGDAKQWMTDHGRDGNQRWKISTVL